MAPSSCSSSSIISRFFVAFLVMCMLSPVFSAPSNQTFRPQKLRRIRAYLRKINKPAVRTIQAYMLIYFDHIFMSILSFTPSQFNHEDDCLYFQSPDGDVMDCVPSHLQPAFDHPELKGQRPLVVQYNATQLNFFLSS